MFRDPEMMEGVAGKCSAVEAAGVRTGTVFSPRRSEAGVDHCVSMAEAGQKVGKNNNTLKYCDI